MIDRMFLARKSQLNFYRKVPLYARWKDGQFVLYKPPGITLHEMRLGEERHPEELYICEEDKIEGIQEAQKGFNRQLEKNIQSGNHDKIKETLSAVVTETFTEPRSGSLEGLSETVNIMLKDYAGKSDLINKLFDVSTTDYSTVIHSINVMAFSLGFAFHTHMPMAEAQTLGLCALLHDVGKIKINQATLKAPRKLTDEEFKEIQKHPVEGFNILENCSFNSKPLSIAALEHHEKLDGTGYPHKTQRISETARIIGIIDCYEALTNDDRPYRSAMKPIDALKLLKRNVEAGKYDPLIFEKFAYSLVK